jgi:hypothetical protein
MARTGTQLAHRQDIACYQACPCNHGAALFAHGHRLSYSATVAIACAARCALKPSKNPLRNRPTLEFAPPVVAVFHRESRLVATGAHGRSSNALAFSVTV